MLFAAIFHTLYMQNTLSKSRKIYTEMPITFQDVKGKDYLFCSPPPPPPHSCIWRTWLQGTHYNEVLHMRYKRDHQKLLPRQDWWNNPCKWWNTCQRTTEPYYIGLKTYYFKVWENGLSSKLNQEELISWFYLGDWVNKKKKKKKNTLFIHGCLIRHIYNN